MFSDRDVEANRDAVAAALDGAEVFFGSLLFDFDQVEWLRDAVAKIPTRFVFESALELMSETSVGSFEMKPAPDGQKAGPPPAVKAILAKFGSGKEEDKLVGYLSFLKLGPALLKFVPGRKAKDLRNNLTDTANRNQGSLETVEEAIRVRRAAVPRRRRARDERTRRRRRRFRRSPETPRRPPRSDVTTRTSSSRARRGPRRRATICAGTTRATHRYRPSGSRRSPRTRPRSRCFSTAST